MATLTSAGAVNLTSSTNWSPAQVPVAGDDLVIGEHTLTLDADLVLGSVTFNNAASRLAFTGPARSVTATNGWTISGGVAAQFLTTQITIGNALSLYGKWTFSGSAAAMSFAAMTGGSLTISTTGSDPSLILFDSSPGGTFRLAATNTFTGGTLNTTGRFLLSNGALQFPVTLNGSFWNHNSDGLNVFSYQGTQIVVSGVTTMTWTGDVDNKSSVSLFRFTNWSGVATIDGDVFGIGLPLFDLSTGNTGSLYFVGSFYPNSVGNQLSLQSGTFFWQSQNATLLQEKELRISLAGGTLVLTGLTLENYGRFAITRTSGTLVTDSNTVIRNFAPTGQSIALNSNQLDGRILQLGVDAPTLPAPETVAAETEYGYTGFEQVGTALLIDPAIISSAVLAASMATLQRNPAFVAERTLEDEKPLTFSWPNSTDTVQGQVSIDNGSYVAVAGVIAYFRSESGKYYYTLAHDAADRPAAEGTARYRFYSGSHSVYATLRTMKASPALSEIKDGLAVEATSQNILSGVSSLNNNNRGEFF